MKLFFFILIPLSFLLLTGCTDFRGASQPLSYAPNSSRDLWSPPFALQREYVALTDTTPLQSHVLSLAEIIDIALLQNPSTWNTWSQARAQAAQYGISLQNDFVQVNANASYERFRAAYVLNNLHLNYYESEYGPQLQLSYLLLDFGRTRATSKAALETLYQANFSHNWEINLVIQSVMNDYFSYLSQIEAVKASESDVHDAQITLDAVLEKLRVGLTDIADKVQATTRLLQQKIQLVTQRQLLTTAYTQLLHTMGLPANNTLQFESYPEDVVLFHIAPLDTLLQKAMLNRPDLLAAEANVKSFTSSLIAAQRQLFPQVNSTFDLGRTYYNVNFNDGYDFNVTVSLDFPLFQGFALRNGIQLAKNNLEVAEAQLKTIELQITQEVTQYTSDVDYARENYEYAVALLASAKEDFRLNLAKYKAGTNTIIDLTNAQTSVADAKSTLIQAEKNWYVSLANLALSVAMITNYGDMHHD